RASRRRLRVSSATTGPTARRCRCTKGEDREVHVPFRRTLLTLLAVLALVLGGAGRAEALNIRDIIELSKADLSDQVLIALIEVDRGVFSVDTDTLKKLKNEGVSDPVIVAMIRSGRMPAPAVQPAPVQITDPAPAEETSREREPQVIVIDHHDQQPAAPQVMYPVGYVVPGLYPRYAPPGVIGNTSGRVLPPVVQHRLS